MTANCVSSELIPSDYVESPQVLCSTTRLVGVGHSQEMQQISSRPLIAYAWPREEQKQLTVVSDEWSRKSSYHATSQSVTRR